jgi:hypothetical protein
MQALIAEVKQLVNATVTAALRDRSLAEVTSLVWVQELALELARAAAAAVAAAWEETLVRLSETVRDCPQCGRRRRCKRRAHSPLRVEWLGLSVALPKLYLECGHCDAPGVSIVKLLTGLSCGEASPQLQLAAAYLAAGHSYGEAQRDLEVHYGRTVDRTKVRRMALAVEREAMQAGEQDRQQALATVAQEARTTGVPRLMLEGDGGMVRTGKLQPCTPDDPGSGKTTPKRGLPRRKRPVEFKEVITLDVRAPGETAATALDVLVPKGAAAGERSRRMLALAARKGLGDTTQVVGLGDMGSELAPAFGEAFHAYPGSFWNADWKHTRDYVDAVAKVLERTNVVQWAEAMKQAIWDRNQDRRDQLLKRARQRRVGELPTELEKCPVAALTSYLTNNWQHLRFAELKAEGLPIVSARAEAQVRDRTKHRFRVAGAWRLENVEPKATLRAIIADGRWPAFRDQVLAQHRSSAARALVARLEEATQQGRLSPAQRQTLGLDTDTSTAQARPLAA